MVALAGIHGASSLALTLGGALLGGTVDVSSAGSPGGAGLAIRCAKALVASDAHIALDDALLLVKDGRIEAVGPVNELSVPAGYHELELGDLWVMPGMVDLHSHVAGSWDINGAVFLRGSYNREWVDIDSGDLDFDTLTLDLGLMW